MRTDLKVLRIKERLTQEQMAGKFNISVATYNLIENGKRNGSKKFWLELQEAFKLDDAQVWNMQK